MKSLNKKNQVLTCKKTVLSFNKSFKKAMLSKFDSNFSEVFSNYR